MKILVVEDLLADLKLARVVLAAAGHGVVGAETGEEALAIIRENAPELMLLDLRLPGINGLALVRQLKEDAATRDIPILAMTSYPHDWTQQEAKAAGCTAYISKPIDATSLLAQIADIEAQRKVADP